MASQNDLLVVARFKDLVTKQVTRLARTFATFSRTATKAVAGVARGLGRLTVVLNQGMALVQKMGAGLKKLGSLVRIPVQLAAEQERVEAKLEAVLRATGGAAGFAADELFNMADSLQKVTGFGDEATINAQAILATFKSIKKEGGVFDRSLEVSLDLAELLEGDLQQSVIMIGKALEEPAVGLTALRRVGVTFSTDQIKLIKTLTDTNQMLDAQTVILEGLEGQVGGLARSMRGTFSGALRALNSEWGDFLETIGKQLTQNPKLLAGMEAVIVKLREWKESFFEAGNLGESVQGFIDMLVESIPDLIRGFGGLISFGARFVVILNAIFEAIGKVVNAIGEMYLSISVLARRFELMDLSDVADNLQIIGQTMQGVRSLSGGSFEVSTDDSAFMRMVKEIGNLAPQMADEFAQAFQEALDDFVPSAPETGIGAMGQAEKEELGALLKAWQDFGAGWSEAVQTRLTELRGIQEEVNKLTLAFLDGTQNALVDFLKAMRDETASLGEAFGNLVNTLRSKLSDMLIEFAANRALQGILEGLSSLSGMKFGGPSEEAIATATNTLALNALTVAINAQLGGMGISASIPTLSDDTLGGLEDTIDSANTEQTSIWMGIWDGIKGIGTVFMNVGSWLFNGLMAILSAIGSLIASGVSSAATGIAGLFSSGGPVNYLAGGGLPKFLPRGTDTVPAMLTPGEGVLNVRAMRALGVPWLNAANRGDLPGFSGGGTVGAGGDAGGASGVTVNLSINTIDARGTKEFLTSREGQESIVSVVRRGLSTQPNFQRQVKQIKG